MPSRLVGLAVATSVVDTLAAAAAADLAPSLPWAVHRIASLAAATADADRASIVVAVSIAVAVVAGVTTVGLHRDSAADSRSLLVSDSTWSVSLVSLSLCE